MPVRLALRCSKGRNNSSRSPSGSPPHSSCTSISTRSTLADTRSVTVLHGRGELDGVLEQVAHHRGEHLPVGLDGNARFDRRHGQPDASGRRVQGRGRRQLVDEFAHGDVLAILHGLRQSYLGERATDERPQSHQAALQHGPGAAGDTDVPRLQHLERDDRGVDQVAQLMREVPEPLAAARRSFSRVDWLRPRPYSVTAPAMASSRQRFSRRKSSVLMGASVCTASSVIAWQTSP